MNKKIIIKLILTFSLWYLYGFYRGYNSEPHYLCYTSGFAKLKRFNLRLPFIQKLLNGLTNGFYYILPPFSFLHFINFMDRLLLNLTNKNKLLYIDSYREFSTCCEYFMINTFCNKKEKEQNYKIRSYTL